MDYIVDGPPLALVLAALHDLLLKLDRLDHILLLPQLPEPTGKLISIVHHIQSADRYVLAQLLGNAVATVH